MRRDIIKWLLLITTTSSLWWFSHQLQITQASILQVQHSLKQDFLKVEHKHFAATHDLHSNPSFLKSLEWGFDHSIKAPALVFMQANNLAGLTFYNHDCEKLLSLGVSAQCQTQKPSQIKINEDTYQISTTLPLSAKHTVTLTSIIPMPTATTYVIKSFSKPLSKQKAIYQNTNISIYAQGFWVNTLEQIPIPCTLLFPYWILFAMGTWFLSSLRLYQKRMRHSREEEQFLRWCQDPQADWKARYDFLYQCQMAIQKLLERKDTATIKSRRRASHLEKQIKTIDHELNLQKNEVIHLLPFEALGHQILSTTATTKEKVSKVQNDFQDLHNLFHKTLQVIQHSHQQLLSWKKGSEERGARRFFRSLNEQSSNTHENLLEEQLAQLLQQVQTVTTSLEKSTEFFPKSHQPFHWIQNILTHWHATAVQSQSTSSIQLLDLLKELAPHIEFQGSLSIVPRKPFHAQLNILDTLFDHIEPQVQKIQLQEKVTDQSTHWTMTCSPEHQLSQWGLERIQSWLSNYQATCEELKTPNMTTLHIRWQHTLPPNSKVEHNATSQMT